MRLLGLSVLVALRVSSANESALDKCAASGSSPDEVTLLQAARRVDFHQAVAEKAEEEVASEEKEAESDELSSYRRRRRNGDAHCRRRRACSHWAPDGPVEGYIKTDSSSAIYWEQNGRKHYVGRCNQCTGSDACSSYLFVENSHMDALTRGHDFQCSMANSYYLASPGATSCVNGGTLAANACNSAVQMLAAENGATPARQLQSGSGGSCQDGSWGQVPTGCSTQSGATATTSGDWAAHFKTGPSSGCVSEGYQLVCTTPQR